MSFKSTIVQSIYLCTLCLFGSTMLVGCDESYDLDKLGGDITLFENAIAAPIESEMEITVSDLLSNDDLSDLIKVDEKGRYALHFSGSIDPIKLDVPAIDFDEIDPTLASSHLDFLASLKANPTFVEILDRVGYTGGPLPEIPGLQIPEDVVHAPIADATEHYEFTIKDIPQEVVSISSLKLTDKSTVTLSLHAEGFPKDITHVTFEFVLIPPSQMDIIPVEEDIWHDNNGYHIEHDLPVVNGALDDEVHFEIDALKFDPPLARREDGSILVESDLYYSGKVHINESFSLTGWTPQFDLKVGFKMSASSVKEVSGTVQAQIDGFEFQQAIENLPDILTHPKTCLDLQQVLVELDVNNGMPLALNADVEFQSTFFDGTSSPLIRNTSPLQILADSQHKLVITNDASYAGGEFNHIPNLHKLVERIPRSISIKGTPSIPVSDLTIQAGHTYEVGLGYALEVPIVLGDKVNLFYETVLEDVAEDLRSVTSYFDCAQIEGVVESTLPVDVNLKLYALDKSGNVMNEIKMSNTLLVAAGKTQPFALRLDILAEESTFNKLDKIVLSVSATSDTTGELRPEQYLKITKLSLRLPEGATVATDL